MKRKNMPCGECGCNSCCLASADLPDITIEGMTGSGWMPDVTNKCLWLNVFTYDEVPPAQFLHEESCTLDIEEESVIEFIGNEFTEPFTLSYTGSTLPGPPAIDCCKQPYIAGRRETTGFRSLGKREVIVYRPLRLDVYLQRRHLECLSEHGGNRCVFVLTARVVYQFDKVTQNRGYVSRTSVLTPESDCSVKNTTSWDYSTSEGSLDYDSLDPLGALLDEFSDQFHFSYAYYFDELPDELTIDDEESFFADRVECIGNDYVGELINEVCFEVPFDCSSEWTAPGPWSIISRRVEQNPTRCLGQRIGVGMHDAAGFFMYTLSTDMPNTTCPDWYIDKLNTTSDLVEVAYGLSDTNTPPFVFQPFSGNPYCLINAVPFKPSGYWGGTAINMAPGGQWSQLSFARDVNGVTAGTLELCLNAPSITLEFN